MLDMYSPAFFYAMLSAVFASGLLLVLLYLLRWRHDALAEKYAAWQKEAQDVEVATHAALYDQLHEEKPVYPKITVVVPARNQARQLDFLLPRLLKQEYEGRFEVVVVDQISTDDTPEVLKRLGRTYPHLRQTYVPVSSRYIELRKLAITLGVKAARSEWVIVVNPETVPITKKWLQHYAENLLPDVDFVEAYFNYEDDGSGVARRAILERVRHFNLRLGAYEDGMVLGSETANYAVRKKWFLEQQGFADSLCMPFGEESLLACYHADAERTTFLCSPDTKLQEELPSGQELRSLRVRDAEVRAHLPGAARRYYYKECAASFLTPLFVLLNLAYTVLRIWQDVAASAYHTDYLYADVACLLFWVGGMAFPLVKLRGSLRALQERKFGAYVYLFDLLQLGRNVSVAFSHRLCRSGFVRRYLSHEPSAAPRTRD